MIERPLAIAALAAAMTAGAAAAQQDASPGDAPMKAVAVLEDPDGAEVGSVRLRQTPNGVLIHAGFVRMPEGTHGLHVHETGACEPPFDSAGGHLNPDGAAHGFLDPDGPHAGDLPNVHVPRSGRLEVEMFNARLALGQMLDDDGAAIVVHEGPDDYATDPAGAAGPRIACGVIEPQG
jgi:Cu-Zn family superoxide dismutase